LTLPSAKDDKFGDRAALAQTTASFSTLVPDLGDQPLRLSPAFSQGPFTKDFRRGKYPTVKPIIPPMVGLGYSPGVKDQYYKTNLFLNHTKKG
jgi:hypothetical protein